jgi:hypothetical protein
MCNTRYVLRDDEASDQETLPDAAGFFVCLGLVFARPDAFI